MTESPYTLDPRERRIVETTIADHCSYRGWELFAVNCRSNHVHVVVAANAHPEIVRDQFKAWCTRRLKGSQASVRDTAKVRESWWAARGSHRFLNDQTSLEAAVVYVLEAQDKPR